MNVPELINELRVFPRIFIGVYIYLLYDVVTWFMTLEVPIAEQVGFISVMVGVGAAWFSMYVNSK